MVRALGAHGQVRTFLGLSFYPRPAICHPCNRRIVSDHNGCRAKLHIDLLNGGKHESPRVEIERSGWFVAQKKVRTLDDGARDRDALLLAAGKLRRKVIEPVRQTDKLQRRLRGHVVRGDLRHKFYIFPDRQSRNEIVELEASRLPRILRTVDFPEPEGPSKTRNSPTRYRGLHRKGRSLAPAP